MNFSNEATATAPAQAVTVTEQLDPNLDWSTFQFGDIGFGAFIVNVPPNRTSFSTQFDATATLGVLVDITANIDLKTGLITWTFTSLDPTTLDLPMNPTLGFLPPNTNATDGQGFVTYTVNPKQSLSSGTRINAQATVVFDTNSPIQTARLFNTIDSSPPTSAVNPLPATTTTTTFPVTWSGSDGTGSGIASYIIFVSEDGGKFKPFLTDTTQTSAIFTGQFDHTYAFYSVATSNVGLVQPTPTAAEATTRLVMPPPPLVTVAKVSDVLNKKHLVTQIIVSFSGAVNANEADRPATYGLATAGKKGSFTAKNAQVIKLRSAVYSTTNNTVTMSPKKAFALSKQVQLLVYGTGPSALQDTYGRAISGANNGQPGSNAIAILSRSGVKLNAVSSSIRAHVQANPVSTVVDALLNQNALAGLSKTIRQHLHHGLVRND